MVRRETLVIGQSMRYWRDSIAQSMQYDVWAICMTPEVSSIAKAMGNFAHKQWATLRKGRSTHVRTIDRWRRLWWLAVPGGPRLSPAKRATAIPMFLVSVSVMIEPLAAMSAKHDGIEPLDDLSDRHLWLLAGIFNKLESYFHWQWMDMAVSLRKTQVNSSIYRRKLNEDDRKE